eukprot:scaffold426_cov319-Pavlova_lutheri.AAC.13
MSRSTYRAASKLYSPYGRSPSIILEIHPPAECPTMDAFLRNGLLSGIVSISLDPPVQAPCEASAISCPKSRQPYWSCSKLDTASGPS